jgi:hypothetical protein
MADFEHLRHKPPAVLERPREIVIACAPMKSNINLSRIVRVAGCCGVTRVIVCGNAQIDKKIARDGADSVTIEIHRTLPPMLKQLRTEGYRLVGLEQTTNLRSSGERRSSSATSGPGSPRISSPCSMRWWKFPCGACRIVTTSPRPQRWHCTSTASNFRVASRRPSFMLPIGPASLDVGWAPAHQLLETHFGGREPTLQKFCHRHRLHENRSAYRIRTLRSVEDQQ